MSFWVIDYSRCTVLMSDRLNHLCLLLPIVPIVYFCLLCQNLMQSYFCSIYLNPFLFFTLPQSTTTRTLEWSGGQCLSLSSWLQWRLDKSTISRDSLKSNVSSSVNIVSIISCPKIWHHHYNNYYVNFLQPIAIMQYCVMSQWPLPVFCFSVQHWKRWEQLVWRLQTDNARLCILMQGIRAKQCWSSLLIAE